MGTVEEETDESIYWVELLIEARIANYAKPDSLMKEANELVAITVSSIKTAKERKKEMNNSAIPGPDLVTPDMVK